MRTRCTPAWYTAIVLLVALACNVLPARGDIVLLTFEGLKHGEQVLNFYDGGTGSMGSAGTNYGVTFDKYALALTHGSYVGEPSPPTIMSLINQNGQPGEPLTVNMDVSGGFMTALTFYDIVIDQGTHGTLSIYSGADGTGNQLATMTLDYTGLTFSPIQTLAFSGIAHSVVFQGGNDQIGFDNIGFTSAVPEPSSLVLFALGTGGMSLVLSRMHRRDSRARR
jgi:PEP-CTERM motif